jgi:uncharacterized membrane protein
MKSRTVRLPIVDVFRGFAVAQMIVYHFIYDLNYFGWLHLRMLVEHPWVGWRTAIVTQFLLLVGISLALRTTFKPDLRDFWRRWAQIALAAALVSVGSALVFPERYIWFGILHFVAAALLIVRPLVRFGRWNLLPGLAALAVGWLVSSPTFDEPPLAVLGFVAHLPRTEDYVPLFPWLGVVLIGVALGAEWRRHAWRVPASLGRLNDSPPRLLVFLGSWALTVYLLHQPIMMGALALLRHAGV